MGSSKKVVQRERCTFSAEFKAEAVRLVAAPPGETLEPGESATPTRGGDAASGAGVRKKVAV